MEWKLGKDWTASIIGPQNYSVTGKSLCAYDAEAAVASQHRALYTVLRWC